MELNARAIKKIVREELPGLMKRDRSIRKFILDLSREELKEIRERTDRIEVETESRFDRLLEELRRDREEQSKKWEEQNKKWAEQNKKWEEQRIEQNKKWAEQNKKWAEQNKKWEEQRIEQNKKWAEQNKKWEEQRIEQNKKWAENQKEIEKLYITINRKHDTTLGALGARWGLRTEASFRNALKDILKDFDIKVLNIKEYDGAGEVFDRPEEIELDLILINGMLIIAEIKSSMSRGDMYIFYKKAKFYEKIHRRQVDRLAVISPMVDDKALEAAKKLGIKVYSYADEMGEDIAGEQ
jgi:hypothetical protein